MRVTCVSSCYLPNLWHLVRLCAVDQAVVLDLAPLPAGGRDSFVTRSRVLNRESGAAQWLAVPVLRKSGQSVRDTLIDPTDQRWAARHLTALRHCYPRHDLVAPGFLCGLESVLRGGASSLADVNFGVLCFLLGTLGWPQAAPLLESSRGLPHAPGDRLEIAWELGTASYVAGAADWELLAGESVDESADESAVRRFRAQGADLVRSPGPGLPVPEAGPQDPDAIVSLSVLDVICTHGIGAACDLLGGLVAWNAAVTLARW